MPTYEMLIWALKATWCLIVFAYGACVGSLINVIVYRMPRGLSIVTPPSRCPSCATRLSWRDNIPVLGWVLLRGRCRYCKARISGEYPIVEASVGLLFVLFYVIWYVLRPDTVVMGVHLGWIKPEWARNDALQTWPEFVILLLLLGSLTAMTLVDARTFTIPLPLTWFPAVVALGHVVHAAYLKWPMVKLMTRAPGEVWAIPTPGFFGWGWIGAGIGGILGLGVSNALMSAGLIRRSFEDYAEWEAEHLASAPVVSGAPPEGVPSMPAVPNVMISGDADEGRPPDASANQSPELWIKYPHARREMIRELAFLGPVLGLALAGWYLARWYGGVSFDPLTGATMAAKSAPLWLTVLAGVLLGYLIGGGVVWGVRIFGSLAFGKEAMGLGDVHLMAAVGACLGWIDATLAFFGAAFVGIIWTILSAVFTRGVSRAMPYGPFLAIATVLVLLLKPFIETGLTAMLGRPINIP
jgi:leader peptidase (prepilin peptidase)/N-methyltransferase